MTVLLPADEYLVRPHIVAWLAYPLATPTHERFRVRSMQAAQDWARWRLRQSGLPVEQRKRDLDRALVSMGLEADRQMLAGEIFRRQVLAAEFDDGFFGKVSTRSFGDRAGAYLGKPTSNIIRDLWAKRRPSLALAAGVCEGLEERPSIAALLFGEPDWALPALAAAKRWRRLALQVGHPAACDLLDFRKSDGSTAHI